MKNETEHEVTNTKLNKIKTANNTQHSTNIFYTVGYYIYMY